MSIDAMKQALEALIASEHLLEIKVNKAIERDAADAWVLEKEADLRQHKKAITSLRQAIEQAEKQEPFGYLWPTERHPEFRFTQQLRDGVEGTPVYTAPQPQEEHHAKDCALLQIPSRDCDCVPTTQREWVDLTPTDIADALGPCPKYFSEWTDADVIYFARTLDAKLKDKNT